MILFGGITSLTNGSGANLNDVWWLIGSGGTAEYWQPAAITGSRPAPRSGPSAVYDNAHNRMVIFGGALGFASPCANDVWSLKDANGVGGTPQWAQLSPSGQAPPPRTRHSTVYDPNTNTMIVYGGNDCFSARYGDVWVLSNANGQGATPVWTQLSPQGTAPLGRENATTVYDPATNRLVLYGGDTGVVGGDGNVWVLTNANGQGGTPTWIKLTVGGTAPTPRESLSAVFDAQNDIMTIFGGLDETQSGRALNDTWTLTSANGVGSPAWTQLSPNTTVGPSPRSFHTAVYNQSTNKMVVFGGVGTVITNEGTQSSGILLNDVWVLNSANGLP